MNMRAAMSLGDFAALLLTTEAFHLRRLNRESANKRLLLTGYWPGLNLAGSSPRWILFDSGRQFD
jgi:hypothetical protein